MKHAACIWVILVLVLRESVHFSQRHFAKTIITFPSQVTLIFDLMTSKLLCQLLLKRVTSLLSLNVGRFFVFELTVDTGQTDRQTNVKRNTAS